LFLIFSVMFSFLCLPSSRCVLYWRCLYIIVLHFHLVFINFTSCNKWENVHSAINPLKNSSVDWISHNVLCFSQDVSFCLLPITQLMLSKTCYIFGVLIFFSIIGYKSLCIPLYFNTISTVKLLIKLII
jgi:hypothetical protein